MAGREITPENDFKDRLVKLIPAEFIAAYLTINNLVQGNDEKSLFWTQVIAIAVMFAVLPFYQLRVLNIRGFGQNAATCGAFLLWVASIGSPLNSDVFRDAVFPYQPLHGTVAMVLWTLVAPVLNKKSDE
jgi:hypothetical protein